MENYKLPPELNQPLPRRVKPSRVFKFKIAAASTIFTGLGLCLIYFVYSMDHDPYEDTLTMGSIIGSLFGTMYILLIAYNLSVYFKEKKLVMWGQAVPATIIREEEVRANYPTVTAIYEFTDIHGDVVQSRKKELPAKEQRKYKTSQEAYNKVITNPLALYDPEDSKKSILYPSRYVDCCVPLQTFNAGIQATS